MKKISLFFAILFVASLAITTSSCKKEKPASLSCTIDGTQFNSLLRTNTKGAISDWDKNGFVLVSTDAGGKYLTLLIAGDSEKEYGLELNIFSAKAGCTVIYNAGGEDGEDTGKYTGTAGKITVTEIDEEEKLISGTFSFTLVNVADATKTIQITDGVFEYLSYREASISSAMISAFASSKK